MKRYTKKYEDKYGEIIREGDVIRHDDGDVETVYACGDNDLGVSATNLDYIEAHPEVEMEFYPLSEFDLTEWEIVK